MYSIRWKRAFSRETGRMKLKGANIRSFCTSVVAELMEFDKGKQAIVKHLSSSDNIDNIIGYLG